MARKLTRAELEASQTQFTPMSHEKRSAGEVISTFFTEHKGWLPIVIVLVILVAVWIILSQTASRADITVMVASAEGALSDEDNETLTGYLQYYTPDIDDNTSTTCKIKAGYFNLTGKTMNTAENDASQALESAVTDGSISVFIADAGTAQYLEARGALADFSAVLPDADIAKGVNAIMVSDTDIFDPKTGYFDFAENDGGLSEVFGGYYILVSKAAVEADDSAAAAAAKFIQAVIDGMGKNPVLRTVPETASEAQ